LSRSITRTTRSSAVFSVEIKMPFVIDGVIAGRGQIRSKLRLGHGSKWAMPKTKPLHEWSRTYRIGQR
jgi:hypothetical protein